MMSLSPQPPVPSTEAHSNEIASLLPRRLFYFKTAAIYWSPWYFWPIETPGWHGDEVYHGPTWHSSGQSDFNVNDQDGNRLLSFPLAFLLMARAKYQYILDVVSLAFEEHGWLQSSDGAKFDLEDFVSESETIVFVRQDGLKSACRPRSGPYFEEPYGLIESWWHYELTKDANEETTPEMLAWKDKLIKRDGPCFIWDRRRSSIRDCQAVHVLAPKWYDEVRANRPHLRQILKVTTESTKDFSYDEWLYHLSSGLILSDDLHYMWEVGIIALWPQWNGQSYDYIVHVLQGAHSTYRDLHGKLIRRDHHLPPDPEMILFHYQQCAMKMLRGFPYGPLPCIVETLQESMEHCNTHLLGGSRR